ncbi:MAG: DNA gyrase/topoisomerase IV subunit A, partial [Dysgonamonadaceae bacterium]|nr:DNA gyrase/topoisomerase IV subunit A [Dysgonamonadaceae bacterium]
VTRDKEYDLTQATSGSRIVYFSANPNGEAETIRVILKPKARQKILTFDRDFSDIVIKGRQSMGNLLTKAEIHKISLKQKGISTLGGRKVWFDRDVLRLNYDGRGEFLGEFLADDKILVVMKQGDFYMTNFDLSNHYGEDILIIEKYKTGKIWSVALFDADQQYFPYLKRFTLELTVKKQNFLGEHPDSKLVLLTDQLYPRVEVIFGGNDHFREALTIDVEEFIAVKSFKAKGKRITTYAVEIIRELEPLRFPELEAEREIPQMQEIEPEEEDKSQTDILDELTGQMNLFDQAFDN